MTKTIILAESPEIVLKLEKYGLIPPFKQGGKYHGCAKKWAREKRPPYDTAEAQALAERLPEGWEELTQNEMNQLIEKLDSAILERRQAELDTPNLGSQTMIRNLAKMALTGVAMIAVIIRDHGTGILPSKDKAEKKRAEQLTFELFLELILGGDLLTQLYETIAETTDTTTANQKQIAEILKFCSFLLVILIVAHENEDERNTLFANFRDPLAEGVNKTESFVTECVVTGKIEGSVAEGIAMYLQQARMAIEKEDYEGLHETLIGALELLEITPEQFYRDLQEIRKSAEMIYQTCVSTIDEETNKIAAMSQVM